MCTPSNIKLSFTALGVLKGILTVVLMVYGLILLINEDFSRAYGEFIKGYGSGFVVVAVLTPFSTKVGLHGAKGHNKFLLLCHATSDVCLLAVHLSLALSLVALTATEFASGVRADCLKNTPDGDAAVCASYLSSDRVAGMKLVWLARFERAMNDANTLAELQGWESGGGCCGFGPPLGCEEDTSKYPSHLSRVDVPPAWVTQRTTCGYEDEWYPTSGDGGKLCEQYINPDANNLVVGGCKYEFPGPVCKDEDVLEDSAGCAAHLQDVMDAELAMYGGVLACLSSLEAFAIFLACCYCWKRKHHDVLPDYLSDVSSNPYAVVKASTSSGGQGRGAFELMSTSEQLPDAEEESKSAPPGPGAA